MDIQIAKGDADEGKLHEYYVTAEILRGDPNRVASRNVNVTNPDYKPDPEKRKRPAPADSKGLSKKDQKGAGESYKERVYDWWEEPVKVRPFLIPDRPKVGNGLLKVFIPSKEEKKMMKQHKKEEEKGKCFCDRDLTVEDFKKIIFQMRNSEKIPLSKTVFNSENCTVPINDRTFEKLTEVYNKVFKRYEINTCIRKIHFFAQTYWEADRLNTTVEYSNGEYLNPENHNSAVQNGHIIDGDGPRYKGRGLMQLTWRNTYKEYFKYIVKKFPDLVGNQTVEQLINRKGVYEETYFYFEKDEETKKNIKRSKIYKVDGASLVGSNIELAVDSAGWFWKEYKKVGGKNLNDFSDYGDLYIDKISILVNGGGNGKANRKTYYESLRDNIFKIKKNCINYSKIKKDA